MIARHKTVLATKDALDKNGSHIPFPIRSLDFDNGKSRSQALEIVSEKGEE